MKPVLRTTGLFLFLAKNTTLVARHIVVEGERRSSDCGKFTCICESFAFANKTPRVDSTVRVVRVVAAAGDLFEPNTIFGENPNSNFAYCPDLFSRFTSYWIGK
jgi:hypothetical protein